MHYHTFGDKRASAVPRLAAGLRRLNVAQLWALVKRAASDGNAVAFRNAVLARADEEDQRAAAAIADIPTFE